MTFSSVEGADTFLRALLRGREGRPLLVLARDTHAGVLVSGTWEDPAGVAVAVIENNRVVSSSTAALCLHVEDGSVTLTFYDELVWRVTTDGDGATVEGLFFANQAMVALAPWAVLRWTAEEAERVLENALADIGTDAPEPFGVLGSPASTPSLR